MVSYFFLKRLGKFVHARDAARRHNFLFTRFGAREGYVFAYGAVEQERLLQNDSELRAIRIQTDTR